MNINITYYKNRKLYSSHVSRYVNLMECKELIDAGHNIKFTHHSTGEDVTEQCLKELVRKCDINISSLMKLLGGQREK
jgi:polyhydroxyalkanoate synthesis regulator protein